MQTTETVIADLKRTLEFVNSQNSALIEDRNSWRRVAERLENEKQELAAKSSDCSTCANRGKVNGLSQESFCESCIYSDKWKKDHYKTKP